MRKIRDYRRNIIIFMSALPIYVLFSRITIFGDDAINKEYSAHFNTIDSLLLYVWHQYFTWSSRIIVNFIMYFVESRSIQFFAIITSLLFILLIVSLSKIFNKEHKLLIDIAIILVMYCIPFVSLTTASWIATTTTYLWPTILATYAVTSLFVDKKNYVNVFRLPSLVLSALYAANNEQVMIVLLLIFSFEIYYHKFSFDSKGICIYLQELMIILNVLLILFSPGNHARNVEDIKHFFPDFLNLSLINKLDMGIMSTGQHFIFGFNVSLILLLLMVSIYYYYLPKELSRKWHLLVSLSTLALLIILSFTFLVSNKLGRFRNLFYFPKEGLLQSGQPFFYVLFLACINLIVFASLLYSISIFKNFKKNRIIYEIFIAGLASRIAISTSATQYASASRTFFTFEFCLLIIILIVLTNLLSNKKSLAIKLSVFSPLLMAAIINLILFTVILNPKNQFISQNLSLWLGIFYN